MIKTNEWVRRVFWNYSLSVITKLDRHRHSQEYLSLAAFTNTYIIFSRPAFLKTQACKWSCWFRLWPSPASKRELAGGLPLAWLAICPLFFPWLRKVPRIWDFQFQNPDSPSKPGRVAHPPPLSKGSIATRTAELGGAQRMETVQPGDLAWWCHHKAQRESRNRKGRNVSQALSHIFLLPDEMLLLE